MNVFAKIFAQIFDSSIASDYVVRHVFMDLLVLADREGVVDMTLDAISRRTNVPEEMVAHAIAELMREDRKSRSHEEDGRRIVPIDSHRDWGWQIVNYEHYRNIRDEEARRTYFRDKKREQRLKSTGVHSGQESPQVSNLVKDSTTRSNKVTQGEGEGEGDIEVKRKLSSPSQAQCAIIYGAYPRKIGKLAAFKAIEKALRVKPFDAVLLAVQAYARKCSRDGTEERFIAHPATWFNQGRYEDEGLTLPPKPLTQYQRDNPDQVR